MSPQHVAGCAHYYCQAKEKSHPFGLVLVNPSSSILPLPSPSHTHSFDPSPASTRTLYLSLLSPQARSGSAP
jgi:hypothetical protein